MSESSQPKMPKSVLVALSDKVAARQISIILEGEKKIENVTVVMDGEAAIAALKKGGFDCIILDWKLAKLPGVVLFNRIRQDERFFRCPVLVISPPGKSDFAILHEYPPANATDSGFSPKAFTVKFELLVAEANQYLAYDSHLNSIASKLNSDIKAAREELDRLVRSVDNKVPLYLVAGHRFKTCGAVGEAESESMFKEAQRADRQCIVATLELAKIYVLTNRYGEAYALLNLAKVSSKNLERILLMGEISMKKRKPEDAENSFAAVLAVDAAHPKATHGKLLSTNLKTFLKSSSEDLSEHAFSTLLTLVGDSLLQADAQGKTTLAHYQAALSFMYADVDKGRILYHMGLTYVQLKMKKEALDFLRQAAKLGNAEAAEQVKKLAKTEASSAA